MSNGVYTSMVTKAPPEKREKKLKWGLRLAIVALIMQTSLLVIALFGPDLPYLVPAPMSSAIDSEQFIRTLAAVTGSRITSNKPFQVLTNAEQYYPAELAAIKNAKQSVVVECYIFEHGDLGKQFIDAMAERARAGVKVHLVADAIGSASLDHGDLKTITDAGGKYAWYHPIRWYTWPRLNNRTHRELFVIDGTVGFIGGAGVADHWMKPVDDQPRWRDTMVRVEGQAVVDMQGTAAENWLEAAGEILTGDAYFGDPPEPGDVPALVVRSSPTQGRSSPARILFQTLL